MNNNQHKQKTSKTSAWSNLLIILLIAIIMVTSSMGLFAWAKYTTATDGTATAQVAKWSFKLVDGITETSEVIDFAFTRTDGYEHVVEGKLAPGTFGEFQIGLDARGTETILEYTIDVALENKPTNLKLYEDSAKTKEITVTNNTFSIDGFMSLEDVKEIKIVTVYWDWPYETGDTVAEKTENDALDTDDAEKTMTMEISVTGTEVLEEPTESETDTVQRLADVVEVGDYVNYDANDNGSYSYTVEGDLTGTTAGINTFSSSDNMKWRVLNIDKETGKVELMSADPTINTVTLYGLEGFKNAETVLTKVGDVYGHGKGSTGGRSITLEDIEKYSNYDKTVFSAYKKYGETMEYTSGIFYNEIKDGKGNVTGYETNTTVADSSNPVTITNTFYDYSAKSYFSSTIIYNMIFNKSTDSNTNKPYYWLASRSTMLLPDSCGFYVRLVGAGGLHNNNSFNSNSNEYVDNNAAVTVVVSLQSNIKTTGQDENGVWQLEVN